MKSLLLLLMALSGATVATEATDSQTDSFAIQMFSILAATQEGNTVYSPAGAEAVLQLLKQGARGSTAAELNSLPMGKPGIKHTVTPDIANALFVADSITLKEGIQTDTVMRVPFDSAPAKAVATINHWAAAKTKDRISSILTPGDVSPNTKMVAANAIYLKAEWSKPFGPEFTRENAVFTSSDGTTGHVAMMWQQDDFRYAEGEDWQAVALYYKPNITDTKNADSVCFIGILPKGNARDFARTLTPQKYQGIRETLAAKYPQDTIVYLPRFEVETPAFSLKTALTDCGLNNAFSASANFSGFCDTPLLLSDVLQRGYIRINESGTEAAAVTMAIMEDSCCPYEEPRRPNVINFNRPFIWVIADLNTPAAPYFMGITEKP